MVGVHTNSVVARVKKDNTLLQRFTQKTPSHVMRTNDAPTMLEYTVPVVVRATCPFPATLNRTVDLRPKAARLRATVEELAASKLSSPNEPFFAADAQTSPPNVAMNIIRSTLDNREKPEGISNQIVERVRQPYLLLVLVYRTYQTTSVSRM